MILHPALGVVQNCNRAVDARKGLSLEALDRLLLRDGAKQPSRASRL